MVAIAAVVAERVLNLRPVHIPAPDLAVRWVATSELDDPAPFLKGGELLLTTGLETKGWRREWRDYVARLIDVGVSGLGIGTGLTHPEPPIDLVRACERAGMNLIEVPRDTAFVAVSLRIAELLEEEQAEAARVALDLQRRLTAAASRPRAAPAIVETLARLLGGMACTMSPDGHVLLGPFGKSPEWLPIGSVAEEVARIRRKGLRTAATIAAGGRSTAIHPIGLSGRPSSYLAAQVRGRPTDAQRSAVTTAVSLLGLVAEQERARTETGRMLQDKAIQLLLAGDPATAQLVLEVDPNAPRLPARVRVLRMTGAQEALDDARAYAEDQRFVAGGNDELCVIAPPGRAGALATEMADRGALVGIGQAVPLARAGAGHDTAGLALAQATELVPVVAWERVVAEAPLSLVDQERVQAFAASFLGGLDDEQMDTLRSFLRHHGSRLRVAEELGVHRNTVRNRIEAIEATTGGSLDDPRLRVSAWIALQAH
jgi:purine catabolism regulator